jgi:hypothetical protein
VSRKTEAKAIVRPIQAFFDKTWKPGEFEEVE